MSALIFSTLVLSFIITIYGISLNTYTYSDPHNLYNINNNNNSIDMVYIGDARVELLKAKRRESDGPTILAYIMIVAAIIIPNVSPID